MELKLPQKLQENPHPIYVGSWGPGSTEIDAFHGYIDELRFSDEVLEPDELGFSGTLLDVYPERKLTTRWATLKREQYRQNDLVAGLHLRCDPSWDFAVRSGLTSKDFAMEPWHLCQLLW